jgi:hypothetical protein
MQKTAHSAGVSFPKDLTLLGTFWDVVLGIQTTLAGPEPATLAAARERLMVIRNLLDSQLPGPQGGMPSLLPDSASDDPVAVIMNRLRAGELFTVIAADYAGEPVTAWVVRYPETSLNRAEAEWLAAGQDGSTRCMRRRGELRTARGDKLAARVTAAILPARVRDETALKELAETDIPLGAVVDRLGGRREPLWIWPYCGTDTILNACGRIWLPGDDGREVPAALATEQVMPLDWWAAP